jgi:hypothetical protein
VSETEPRDLPLDHDAPGQVDFPDPAFDDDGDADGLETPAGDEPAPTEE